jgi:hypothetical protein
MSEDHGCQPIGNLAQQIALSLKPVDSIRMNSPTSSGTTGVPSPAARRPSSTGRQLTATVAAGHDHQVTPEEVDAALLASLKPSVAFALQETTREFVDPVYGYDCEFTGYTITDAVPYRDLQTDTVTVENALAPADAKFVRMELARLRASTKAREQPGDDLAMILQVFAEECQNYPPDVVRHALRSWAKREVFFPALAEIRDELQRHAKRRRALLECLRHGLMRPWPVNCGDN